MQSGIGVGRGWNNQKIQPNDDNLQDGLLDMQQTITIISYYVNCVNYVVVSDYLPQFVK